MKKNLENLSIEDMAFECMMVELNDLEKNDKSFGMTKEQIIKEYLYKDDEFILDMLELYFGDIEEF